MSSRIAVKPVRQHGRITLWVNTFAAPTGGLHYSSHKDREAAFHEVDTLRMVALEMAATQTEINRQRQQLSDEHRRSEWRAGLEAGTRPAE